MQVCCNYGLLNFFAFLVGIFFITMGLSFEFGGGLQVLRQVPLCGSDQLFLSASY